MKKAPQMMTNRELMTAYDRGTAERYSIVEEMAKRINRHMITPDVVPLFKQYKLNGAGDMYR